MITIITIISVAHADNRKLRINIRRNATDDEIACLTKLKKHFNYLKTIHATQLEE